MVDAPILSPFRRRRGLPLDTLLLVLVCGSLLLVVHPTLSQQAPSSHGTDVGVALAPPPSPVPTPAPTPTTLPDPGVTPPPTTVPAMSSDCALTQLEGCAVQLVGATFGYVGTVTLTTVQGAVQSLLSSINILTSTPPALTTENPTVITFWRLLVGIADSALGVVLLWCGYGLMARESVGLAFPEAMQIMPRVLLGMLAVHTSLAFTSSIIALKIWHSS